MVEKTRADRWPRISSAGSGISSALYEVLPAARTATFSHAPCLPVLPVPRTHLAHAHLRALRDGDRRPADEPGGDHADGVVDADGDPFELCDARGAGATAGAGPGGAGPGVARRGEVARRESERRRARGGGGAMSATYGAIAPVARPRTALETWCGETIRPRSIVPKIMLRRRSEETANSTTLCPPQPPRAYPSGRSDVLARSGTHVSGIVRRRGTNAIPSPSSLSRARRPTALRAAPAPRVPLRGIVVSIEHRGVRDMRLRVPMLVRWHILDQYNWRDCWGGTANGEGRITRIAVESIRDCGGKKTLSCYGSLPCLGPRPVRLRDIRRWPAVGGAPRDSQDSRAMVYRRCDTIVYWWEGP